MVVRPTSENPSHIAAEVRRGSALGEILLNH